MLFQKKATHTWRDYETINKISCIPCACSQVAAERLENPYGTTNSFHLGASFLHTSLDALQRMVLAPSTRPWRAQASSWMPDKRAVLEIVSPLSPIFILLPLSLYYNLNSFFFFSFPLLAQAERNKAGQNSNSSSGPANATGERWTSSQVYSTTIRCLLWHFSLLPVPQHSTVSSFPLPCFTASSFLSSHSGSPLLYPYLLLPLSAWCD